MAGTYRTTAMLALLLLGGAAPATAQEADSAVAEARRFVALLQAGKWEDATARMTAEAAAGIGASRLEAGWTQIRSGLGELRGMELLRVEAADSTHVVDFAATFGTQKVLLRLALTQSRQVAGFRIMPLPAESTAPGAVAPYVDAARFREEPVELGHPEWRLGGTLTVPVAPGPHPAVVLVHGSGPQDRDQTLGPNRVFRDLAQGLASQGIVVLRYDKRTHTHGVRMTAVSVEAEVIEDALAALQMVRGRAEVDAGRVHLLGHSLGAQLGPEIAERDGRLAGLILLAAPARRIGELIAEQLAYLATLPQNQGEARQQIEAMQAQIARLHSPATPDTAVILGAPASWFRELDRHDPIRTALRLSIPLLVLHGERDYQVPPSDASAWADALKRRPGAHVRLLSGLNHHFLHGEGPPNPAEYARPGHVAPVVISAIAEFIR